MSADDSWWVADSESEQTPRQATSRHPIFYVNAGIVWMTIDDKRSLCLHHDVFETIGTVRMVSDDFLDKVAARGFVVRLDLKST